MKRHFFTAAIIAIAMSLTTSSCIGSFKMYNSLMSWNKQVGNKFVNELVFIAFWILPAYEISFLADVVVLNSIEFWSGNNPMGATARTVTGEDGTRYLVKSDADGYTVTRESDRAEMRLDYDAAHRAWDITTPDGTTSRLMTFVDDTHVSISSPDGGDRIVELSEAGLLAYREAADALQLAAR